MNGPVTIPACELGERVMALRESVRRGDQKAFRTTPVLEAAAICDSEGLDWPRRAARLTELMCAAEKPVILPHETIAFTRTIPAVPPYYSPEQWREKFRGHAMHESGMISNICADWALVLREGLEARKAVIAARYAKEGGEALRILAEGVATTIDAVLSLATRYRDEAARKGLADTALALDAVPSGPARTFHEAIQSLKFTHSALWLSGHYHVGLGRFDQYMWPYAEADISSGRADWAEIADLIGEFFISLNKDSDLYPGIQQGDNGQSIMLGGVDREGNTAVNPLTYLVLDVARHLRLIDPKINLRLTPDTPWELLVRAVEMTKLGLGFPQYSNDDAVIPGLVTLGYRIEDARDYSVAACWEFIIPGRDMDVVNIGAVSFPHAADAAIRRGLRAGAPFDGIMGFCCEDIDKQVARLVDVKRKLILPPAPFYSALMTDQLELRGDLSDGAQYNNLGIHGSGSANAADALAAVRKLVLREKVVTGERLVAALDDNFAHDTALLETLRNDAPKTGNNDADVDDCLVELFSFFADACAKYRPVSGRWNRVRAGSGSAMFYVWLARGGGDMLEPTVGATADGRRRGDFFSSSLAPAQGVKVSGPFGILQTFAKIDYARIANGGPITLELSDSVFRTADSIGKVADLVMLFQRLGCQQLQLNTLNVENLIDAKKNPENHRNLVVRVWGWSGYFCELSEEYQDQIIRRHMLLIE